MIPLSIVFLFCVESRIEFAFGAIRLDIVCT